MFWKLLVAFTVIPAIELYLLVSIGQVIGPLATVLLIVLTGLVGAAMAKREGLAVIKQLRDDLGKGIPPASHLVEGGMVLAGGLLLLTPGILTDVTGFVLILPWSRPRLAPRISAWLLQRFDLKVPTAGVAAAQASGPSPKLPSEPGPEPFDHPVA